MDEDRASRATETEDISAVAHELRTPIAALRGAVKELRRSGDTLDPDARERLLTVIDEAGDQLLRLTDDLVVVAAGPLGVPVRIEPCDARAIAEGVIAAAKAATGDAHVVLDAPDSLPSVAADPARLRQVIANLVDNALVHGEGERVILALTAGESTMRLAVADSGPGVPTGSEAAVFERHMRFGARPGSGLGLTIVQELVERMAGSVALTSTPGTGTTVTVELPLA